MYCHFRCNEAISLSSSCGRNNERTPVTKESFCYFFFFQINTRYKYSTKNQSLPYGTGISKLYLYCRYHTCQLVPVVSRVESSRKALLLRYYNVLQVETTGAVYVAMSLLYFRICTVQIQLPYRYVQQVQRTWYKVKYLYKQAPGTL